MTSPDHTARMGQSSHFLNLKSRVRVLFFQPQVHLMISGKLCEQGNNTVPTVLIENKGFLLLLTAIDIFIAISNFLPM